MIIDQAVLAMTITGFAIFGVFVGFFIWGLKTDQFKDIEEPKYTMLGLKKNQEESGEDDSNA